MRINLTRLAFALALCSCLSGAPAHGQTPAQHPEAPLTNAAIVKLVRAGFQEKTIIAIIHSRPARFDVTTERLVELKKSGVSEKIILAMLGRANAELMADDWGLDDDLFSGADSNRPLRPDAGTGAQTGAPETNIFGSSGGASGRSRTNGIRGGQVDDTVTTGSATVRILRPPTEAGGAPPTLERTPTLTNESIIELIEAGFSEGTIIRRIENSPVDFDLSPDKLVELRRRRTSEPIIIAMKAAMADDSNRTTAKPEM